MKNLTVSKNKEVSESIEVKDNLGIGEEIKDLLFDRAIQNTEIKGDLYFIRTKELEKLPSLIVQIVDQNLGD